MVASRALGRAEPILIWPWHGAQQFYADTVDPVSQLFCVLYIILTFEKLKLPHLYISTCL